MDFRPLRAHTGWSFVRHAGLAVGLLCGVSCGIGLEYFDALCADLTCASPPAPTCSGEVLRGFSSGGRCLPATGECVYPVIESPCALGCFDGTRCRAEGDVVWRSFDPHAYWAVGPTGDLVTIAMGEVPGCTTRAAVVRRFTAPSYAELPPVATPCLQSVDILVSHPSVTAASSAVFTVVNANGVQANHQVWALTPDGSVAFAKPDRQPGTGCFSLGNCGSAAIAVDGEDVYVSSSSEARVLRADGSLRWRTSITTQGGGSARVALVGHAFVTCFAGCAAFDVADGRRLFGSTQWGGVAADGGSLRTSVLVIDPRGRPVVGTGDGLAALEMTDGGVLARWPAVPPTTPLAITAAVVEQRGTLVLALGSALVRLGSEDLGELTRVALRCPAHELVARRDGSLLAMVRCPDTDPEPGTALWGLDAELQPMWKARPPLYTSASGQVLVDARGTIYTNMGGVLSVLIGQQPPADSAWPMSSADAQRSGRSAGFDAG